MADAIVIFARAPVPGQVKTRLAKKLGADLAAAVYDQMLHDTLTLARQAARSWGHADVWLAHSPTDAMTPGPHSLGFWTGPSLPQCEGDLGTRMLSCIQQVQTAGADRVIIIGSDSPQMPPSVICHTLSRLHQSYYQELGYPRDRVCDLILGPAADGGFYLLGVSQALPPAIFADVQWSSSHTRAQVEANAEKLGLRVGKAWKYHDVDTYNDLLRLARRCPRYERFLQP
jgi:rSAM/selenodomain-associated transferase 1